ARDESFVRTPRGLNEPVRWKSSAFRWTGAPTFRDSVADENIGVRCRRPAIASRAARTSSRESSAAMERFRGLAGELRERLARLWLRRIDAAEVADVRDEQHRDRRDDDEASRDPERLRDADPARHG